jgi:hypothetical protein
MSKSQIKRHHARFACDLPVEIFSPVSQAKLADARLFDVGLGGGNVYSDFNLQRAVSYEFRLSFGKKEQLAVLGQVVWSAPTDQRERFNRYGVTFNLTSSQEALMSTLVDQLSRAQSS